MDGDTYWRNGYSFSLRVCPIESVRCQVVASTPIGSEFAAPWPESTRTSARSIACFNSLHDWVSTCERVSYAPLASVEPWVESTGVCLGHLQIINCGRSGHEMVEFSRSRK